MTKLSVILLLLSCIFLKGECSSIKMPSFAHVGDSFNIECNIDLGTLLATSITFYKENKEIYKFTREAGTPNSISVTPVPGVTFNMEKRDKPNEIELMNVVEETSGNYSCRAIIDHKNMTDAWLSGSLKIVSRKKQATSV